MDGSLKFIRVKERPPAGDRVLCSMEGIDLKKELTVRDGLENALWFLLLLLLVWKDSKTCCFQLPIMSAVYCTE